MQTTVILLAIVAIADSYCNNCKTVGLNLISADSCYNNRQNINGAVKKSEKAFKAGSILKDFSIKEYQIHTSPKACVQKHFR